MNCALRQETAPLRDSHIVPEFFYRAGYNAKGRMVAVPWENTSIRFVQKGIREKLLCDGCEQFLNEEYELPFSRAWRKVAPKNAPERVVHLQGLDYRVTKVLLLSVLWRAHVAQDNMWDSVKLGRHADKIREMILSGEPGDETTYQIFAAALVWPNSPRVLHGLVSAPMVARRDARRIYIMAFGGFAWYFVVSSHPLPEDFSRFCLRESGSILAPVMNIRDFTPVSGLLRMRPRRPAR